ncbi:hypothetical protein GCK32_021823, partial [Trichostrongylus colubriformis]
IVELSAASCDCAVNTTAKAHWNKKFHNTKIISIGTKIKYKRKIKDVTEDGTTLQRFITVGEKATSVPGKSADEADTDSIAEALHEMDAGMDELVEQMAPTKKSLPEASREFEVSCKDRYSAWIGG